MKKPLILAGFIFLTSLHAQTGNTGINTTAPKATLDVNLPSNYANGQLAGVTIPQLTGDQIEAMSAATPKVGTIVYATAVSTATTKDVTAVGYWYWKDATDKWEPFTLGTSAAGNTVDWSVNGNSGTTAANYLGTKDSQPLNFKTNATTDTNPKMTILPNGNVGIGTNILSPRTVLYIENDNKGNSTMDDILIRSFSTTGLFAPGFFGSTSRGTATNPQNLENNDFLVSYAGGGRVNGAEKTMSEMYAKYKGNGISNLSNLSFRTSENDRMIIDENGNVGINNPTPQAKLDIVAPTAGTGFRLQDGTQGAGKVLTSDGSGNGSWKTNVAVAPTILGTYGTGIDIAYTQSGWSYTGSYITLPPNSKYVITINFLIGLVAPPLDANASIFVRTMFSDIIGDTSVSSDVLDGTLISGTIGSAAHYGNVSGSVIIRNSSSSAKTYYLNAGAIIPNGTTKTISKFGGNSWQERTFFAVPIN